MDSLALGSTAFNAGLAVDYAIALADLFTPPCGIFNGRKVMVASASAAGGTMVCIANCVHKKEISCRDAALLAANLSLLCLPYVLKYCLEIHHDLIMLQALG